MIAATPKDDEIVACLLGYASVATYVVKNKLRDKYKGIKTASVLRRLKKLEAAGHVRRAAGLGMTHIYWEITPLSEQRA